MLAVAARPVVDLAVEPCVELPAEEAPLGDRQGVNVAAVPRVRADPARPTSSLLPAAPEVCSNPGEAVFQCWTKTMAVI